MDCINREIYLDAVIKALYIEENETEEEYKRSFLALTKLFCALKIDKLYKYRSDEAWSRDVDLFKNDKIWIPSMDSLNDPFEFSIDFNSSLLDNMEDYVQLKDKIKNLVEEYSEYRSKCSAFSMCESNSNLLLWSHYANAHKGYCVEYDSIDILQQFQCFLLPVVYQHNYLKAENLDLTKPTAPFELALRSVVTKSIEWRYEQEWRVVRTCQSNIDKSEHTIKFPKPTAVYLGCNADCNVENEILKICNQKQIPVYKMQKSITSYSIYPQILNG